MFNNVKNVLRHAAGLVRTRWTKGSMTKGTGDAQCFCAVGALRAGFGFYGDGEGRTCPDLGPHASDYGVNSMKGEIAAKKACEAVLPHLPPLEHLPAGLATMLRNIKSQYDRATNEPERLRLAESMVIQFNDFAKTNAEDVAAAFERAAEAM